MFFFAGAIDELKQVGMVWVLGGSDVVGWDELLSIPATTDKQGATV